MKKFHFSFQLCVFSLSLTLLTAVSTLSATDYFVSPSGNDANDGLSEKSPWASIKKVNQSEFEPGDRILFQRGGVWRIPASSLVGNAVLHPASGEPGNPVVYSAYGQGKKPLILGSVSASEENDWLETSPNVWGTRPTAKNYGQKVELASPVWGFHHEGGTVSALKVDVQENSAPILTISTEKSGSAPNHIQLWGNSVNPEELPETFAFKFRARASVSFELPSFHILQSGFPYQMKTATVSHEAALTNDWQEFETVMRRNDAKGERFSWHLNLGKMPSDCELQIQPLEIVAVEIDDTLTLLTDVGNIIFNHGKFKNFHRCGIKKWSLDDLKTPGDYFYDAQSHRVFLYWPENPAKTCRSIELAMKGHCVNHGGKRHVLFDGLAIAYSASHGFGGGSCEGITIRNCDIFYVGGAHQFTRENGVPVRFGNGIEFWGSAKNCLVEKNRIWEIYDAALTNQGRGSEKDPSNEIGVVYRENEIWNSEYSFEYWNSGGETRDVLFEKNVCRDAGFGWAHGQRPDPNGAHLMFYRNSAKTSNFVIRENVFADSTEVCLRMDNDWRDSLTLEKNVYSQTPGKNVVRFNINQYFDANSFEKYQKELGMDEGSVCSETQEKQTVKGKGKTIRKRSKGK